MLREYSAASWLLMVLSQLLMLKLNSLFSESLKLEESTSDSQICGSSISAVEEIYEAFEEGVHDFEPKK